MPRRPRLDLAGVAQHIIQRGNDRQPCFFTEAGYLCYLAKLREISLRQVCRVRAYVFTYICPLPRRDRGTTRAARGACEDWQASEARDHREKCNLTPVFVFVFLRS